MSPRKSQRRSGARQLRDEFLNVPNMLTMMRIAAIPFVMLLLELSRLPAEASDRQVYVSHLYCFWAAVVFGLAAGTDWLDGWLARNMGWTSLIGKLLDPLADKLIVMAALVTLVALERSPAWLVVLLLAREIGISGLRSLASSEGLIIDVVQTGKWKTAFQLVGIIGLLMHYTYPIDFLFIRFEVNFHVVGLTLVGISMAFSLLSAFSYFRSFLRAIAARYR